MDYGKHYSTTQTPQSEPIPGKAQVENSAGGFVFAVDDWTRLDRFLVLGAEGGTYYIKEHALVVENAEAVRRCILNDGPRVVARIVEISQAGRAPKNDPALFALAMCLGLGDDATKDAAVEAVPKVARIGTHLFHLAQYSKAFRGRGRRWRRAFAQWYEEMDEEKLALQLVKYRQRDGWTHRDILRLAHPKPEKDSLRDALFGYAVGKYDPNWDLPARVHAAERAKTAPKALLISLILDYGLPRECVPSEHLDDPEVWHALLEDMPMTAMLRNLGKMTAIGAITPQWSKVVAERLVDSEALRRARIHPIALLSAMKVYASGTGVRGSLSWSPDRRIVDALDDAFYLSFGNVEPAGKRILLAVDASCSMGSHNVNGLPHLSCAEAAAAMALLVAKVERDWEVHGFCSSSGGYSFRRGDLDGFRELSISPKQRLTDAVMAVQHRAFGGTDCALPMLWAMKEEREFDAIMVLTDNETWAGDVHPTQALQRYRQASGLATKLIVWGMASNGFSIADPNDAGMMDVVGLDAAAPNVVSDFVRGV